VEQKNTQKGVKPLELKSLAVHLCYTLTTYLSSHWKRQYITKVMFSCNNIVIMHWGARPQETNILDLGLWQSMQSWTEQQQHWRYALAALVWEAWQNLPIHTISNVFGRYLKSSRLLSMIMVGITTLKIVRGWWSKELPVKKMQVASHLAHTWVSDYILEGQMPAVGVWYCVSLLASKFHIMALFLQWCLSFYAMGVS
jgi:hypothetical protein